MSTDLFLITQIASIHYSFTYHLLGCYCARDNIIYLLFYMVYLGYWVGGNNYI